MSVVDLFEDLINLLNIKGRGNVTLILNKLIEIKAQLTSELDLKADLVGGVVPDDQLPSSVTHALEYKGGWDASGGVYPTPSGLETGWYYVITVAGTMGGTYYDVDDWIVYNGTSWDKVAGYRYSSTDFDTDFATKDTDDLTEGTTNRYFSDALAKAAAISNDAYGASWSTVTDVGASKQAIYNKIESLPVSSTDVYYCSTETEINDAITSIGNGKGVIVLDSGTITLTGTINVNGGGSYVIRGMGDKTSIYATDVAFNVTSAYSCVFYDFRIFGNFGTNPAIIVSETSNNPIRIERVTIATSLSSYDIKITSNNVTIYSCRISSQSIGIQIQSDYNKIFGNYISATDHGIMITSSGNYNLVQNNIFAGSVSGDQINVDGAYNIIDGNFTYNGENQIHLYTSATHCIISNNYCYGQTSAVTRRGAIRLGSCSYVLCINNFIKNFDCSGILLEDLTYSQILGNKIDDSTTTTTGGGIYDYLVVTASSNNIIQDNFISNMTGGTKYGIYLASGADSNQLIFNRFYNIATSNYGDGGSTNTKIKDINNVSVVATGAYTGDDTSNRTITVGNNLKTIKYMTFIRLQAGNTYHYVKYDTMGTWNCARASYDGYALESNCLSFGTGNFTVNNGGLNNALNFNAATYYWVAYGA